MDERDDLMADALARMNDIAIDVRERDAALLYEECRRLVRERPEHVAIMLMAAGCLIDPDESLSARRHRLDRVLAERARTSERVA